MVAEADSIIIALSKGRGMDQTLNYLGQAGVPLPRDINSRKLILDSHDPGVRYILLKPTDVPTIVEYGAADMGICGLDVIRESGRDVYEPLPLPLGFCRLSLAGPKDRADMPLRYQSQMRIATKFPNLATEFFRQRGVNAEIIKLYGSIEIAPVVGLADLIVDIVETGNTLRANGLVEFRTVLEVQEMLIANRAAYRLKSTALQRVIQALRHFAEQAQQPTPA